MIPSAIQAFETWNMLLELSSQIRYKMARLRTSFKYRVGKVNEFCNPLGMFRLSYEAGAAVRVSKYRARMFHEFSFIVVFLFFKKENPLFMEAWDWETYGSRISFQCSIILRHLMTHLSYSITFFSFHSTAATHREDNSSNIYSRKKLVAEKPIKSTHIKKIKTKITRKKLILNLLADILLR